MTEIDVLKALRSAAIESGAFAHAEPVKEIVFHLPHDNDKAVDGFRLWYVNEDEELKPLLIKGAFK